MSHSSRNKRRTAAAAWRNPEPVRALDMLPGTLAWVTLAACVIGAVLLPRLTLMLAVLLALYAATRFTLAAAANLRGLRAIEQTQRTNWQQQYQAHPASSRIPWESVQHVVIIPNFNEPLDLLAQTLQNLARSPEARRSITVLLAMEEREAGAARKAQALHRRFAEHFLGFYYTLHPDSLPGEMRCKSANLRWAAGWIRRELINQRGYDRDRLIVTTMDADTLWHEATFSALTYHFATDPHRFRRFWQAPIRYHRGIGDTHPLMRVVNTYATAFELAFLTADWWFSLPISSYSLSFRLLEAQGGWDPDVIADEWHMFIKAYSGTRGRVTIVPIFLPFLASTTRGAGLWQIVRNRYQQSLRHAWGSKELSYAIQQSRRPGLPLQRGLRLVLRVANDILLPGAGWVLLTAGTQLPILLNPDLRAAALSGGFGDPLLLALHVILLTFFLVSGFVWLVDVHTRPKVPRRLHPAEVAIVLLGFVTMPLLSILFATLPLLHAQTRLMFGQPLDFRVSSKT